MIHEPRFIAADLGASSGRVMVGQWDGNRFSIEELHRFLNRGVSVDTGLYWDVLGIWSRLQEGMLKYHARFNDPPDGIGIDAWGVDFGLLDKRGRLIGNPVHYRDARTRGVPERFFKLLPESEVFAATGTQTMAINTLFQLYCMILEEDPQLRQADTLLMIPDLLLYFLTGEKNIEYTEATTTQMYSLPKNSWSTDILLRAGIPASLFPRVIQPGTIVGSVSRGVLLACGFTRPVPAVAVASHDTASAVAAIPHMDAESAFISSGTWSLVGAEVAEPNISESARKLHFTNEGGADGKVLLMKNVTGFWILQECMRCWKLQGHDFEWSDMIWAASAAKALCFCFDPDDECFQAQDDMPMAIQEYCRTTGQVVPDTIGEIARSAFESLSLKYRSVIEQLELLIQKKIATIRIVGGGSLNTFLCQMTADACRRLVVSGPSEASALGNVMLQAVATGHLPHLSAARVALADSVQCCSFEPRPSDAWDEAYIRFKQLEKE
jgi:rhamnulokinase